MVMVCRGKFCRTV